MSTVYEYTRTSGILGIFAGMSLGKFYYESKYSAGFGSVSNLVKANKKRSHVEEWQSGQAAYTLHKNARKGFPRNPYIVTNFDVCKLDLADLSSLSKCNNKYKNLLNDRHIFTIWLQRTTEAQDCYLNYCIFKIFIPKEKAHYPTKLPSLIKQLSNGT